MAITCVIVDSREPGWAQTLTFGDAAVAVAQIETDYLVLLDDGTLLGIERKSSSDFLSTLRDGRLFPQLERLRQLTPWSYLLICGELRPGNSGKCLTDDGRETGWNWSSVQGALLTVQEIGVNYLTCRETEVEQAIVRLASRERRPVRVQPARELSLMSEGEQIISALPGIGPEKASALLAYCGSPAWALTYLTLLSAKDVPNIGDGTRRRIRKALGLEDGALLHVIDSAGVDYIRKQALHGTGTG